MNTLIPTTYTDTNKGSYESVVVHFYRSFKINAEVPLSDGNILYTKSSKNFQDIGKTGLDGTYANISDNLLTPPSEDAVFFLGLRVPNAFSLPNLPQLTPKFCHKFDPTQLQAT